MGTMAGVMNVAINSTRLGTLLFPYECLIFVKCPLDGLEDVAFQFPARECGEFPL
jgi:hypothetical protein